MDKDEVTKINIGLPGGQRLGADLGQRQHHLQPGARIGRRQALLQGGEAQLAGVADEDDPARDSDHVVGLLADRQMAPLSADLTQLVGAGNRDRIGFRPSASSRARLS